MTERIRKLTIILDADYRDEDESVGKIIDALQMTKGIAQVIKGDAVSHNDEVAREDFRRQIGRSIAEMVSYSPDREFMQAVEAAYELLKRRRGY